MTSETFHALTRALPEAWFVLAGSGEIRLANPAAGRMLAMDLATLPGRNIGDLVTDDAHKVGRYLITCLRNSEPMAGSLVWRTGQDGEFPCRCFGSLLPPAGSDASPLLLLRCEPKALASSRFLALNRSLDEVKRSYHRLADQSEILKREVAERRRSEEALHEQTVMLEQEVAERQMAQEELQQQTVLLEEEIAERTRAQELTRESHERLFTILNGLDAIVYVADMQTYEVLFVNQHVKDLFGDIAGQPCWKTIQTGQTGPCEFCTNSRLVDADGNPAGIYHWEFCNTTNGRWYDIRDRALHWIDGRIVRMEIATDITEYKQAESDNKLLTDQLNQAQRIESIGRLAAGIAHDFNNLLTPIMGYAELLTGECSHNAASLDKIGHILQAADKAKRLVQQLLIFGRKQVLEMRPIDLNDVVSSLHEILRRTIRENIDIHVDLTRDGSTILADKNQIEQIILNLAINAQDAIDGTGTITVATSQVYLDEDYARQHTRVRPGRHMMLMVSDTGCGMDGETLDHIFEPFFTTKRPGEGTGLGLATVYGLVREHGGSIWVYSEPARGTVFKVYFPVIDDVPERLSDRVVETGEIRAAGRTVLLVEDNEMVRQMTKEMLLKIGFDVIEAEGPTQALQAVAGQSIDLLVTDVVMPDMSGPELYERLRQSYPGLRTLFMSGYTESVMVQHGVPAEGINFIQKPFVLKEFARKLESILT